MHLKSFRVSNFRRLVDVTVELDPETTVFVGANNSGKTSATQIFQLLLGEQRGAFSVFDFSAQCWSMFNDVANGTIDCELPKIGLDLWFEVDDENVHRVADFLPDLDWDGEPVGVRISYEPKDATALLHNYREAIAKAAALTADTDSKYRPWPHSMTDYLKKRLAIEFEVRYYSLKSISSIDEDPSVEAYPLGNSTSGSGKLVDALIRVDFLDAQRNLTDGESRGRHENLSKRLSRYYSRNLAKQEADLEALSAISESEDRLNAHFVEAFEPVLGSLKHLGYPGAGNYSLVVKAEFNATSILTSNANVHYALPGADQLNADAASLPDRYNGLGFKNLIYMAVEVLDFHHSWEGIEGDRPPVHLLLIEEPESHLHAQLQQVFIRQIMNLIPASGDGFHTQVAVTTHSSHIIYENEFRAIRYFRRISGGERAHRSDVRDLSKFYDGEEHEIREFLRKYLKLTHCDLFFADGAVLVEGNVERLLIPLMIDKDFPGLRSSHLTILEVGGAFAHKFDNLIRFLDIPTLVITDLDSVEPKPSSIEPIQTRLFDEAAEDDDDDEQTAGRKCMVSTVGAVTSNETLRALAPKVYLIRDLLTVDVAEKFPKDEYNNPRDVRIAYQTEIQASWRGLHCKAAARTLEEAFALENLDWCQDAARKHLGLVINKNRSLEFEELHKKLHTRVNNFDKTRFALGLITEDASQWNTPQYIFEGLNWLQTVVAPSIDADNSSAPSDLDKAR